MASSFYRFTRRSFPSAAAAAASASVFAISLSNHDDRSKKNETSRPTTATAADGYAAENGLRKNRGPLGLATTGIDFGSDKSYRNFPLSYTASLFSPLAFRQATKALCEAPPPQAQPTSSSSQPQTNNDSNTAAYKPKDPAEPTADPVEIESSDGKKLPMEGGMWGEESDGLYHGLFPRRQLWRPKLEYPLWDNDWDGRRPPSIDMEKNESGMTEAQRDRSIRKNGVTRHIILIRHGQYDETHREDSKRLLTPLGREQAALTGKRLGQLVRGVNEEFGPCRVRVVRVSDLARAKETADLIYDNMGLESLDTSGNEVVERAEPDPLLNEGRPCHHIPGGKARPSVIDRTDEHHPRIEQAFRKYFFRADVPPSLTSGIGTSKSADGEDSTKTNVIATTATTNAAEDESNKPKTPEEGTTTTTTTEQTTLKPHPQHEFEIIVCHANVIRYFFCRALQLPPEAWLRLCTFNCSLTYFTIRPTGTVSCRMLGDIGHLPYDKCTFSMHTGFNW
eukprot:CAMPEP_0183707838 /NCGR_PEP_ID=MMETSP0737-20130205/4281_1 /TAXON_ID=385413 /ORGANISM="Thalassiosira miniscula, Strain CCMP1093" /LENGTH=506 /DNA_ID=CAMNT_0025935569 /DNA_START=10 /DNA_END=1530 /DNA_ORIENTATION=-